MSLAIGENFAAFSAFLIRRFPILGRARNNLFNSLFPTLINLACWKIIHELLPTSELPAAPPMMPTVAPSRRPLLPPAAMAYRP
eukprot:4064562-Pleurochrysis_carterae.AAC.1